MNEKQLLADIRAGIRNSGSAYPLSISAGYDVLRGEGDTIQDCMRRADQKLYEEKARKKASLSHSSNERTAEAHTIF